MDGGAGCDLVRRPVFERHLAAYYNTYYWFRVVFIMLLPCGVLVVVNALLVGAIRAANARRRQLLRTQRAVAMATDNDRTTLMLVVVAAIMLVVEFPMVVLFLLILGTQFASSRNGIGHFSRHRARLALGWVTVCRCIAPS